MGKKALYSLTAFFMAVLLTFTACAEKQPEVEYPKPVVSARLSDIDGEYPVDRDKIKDLYAETLSAYFEKEEETEQFLSEVYATGLFVDYTAQNTANKNEYILITLMRLPFTDGETLLIPTDDGPFYPSVHIIDARQGADLSPISEKFETTSPVITAGGQMEISIYLEYLYDGQRIIYNDNISVTVPK